ncbi:MAG: hypothetical protein P8R43_05720 [Planctomycetota bacterium]|nr:hypothetical protein [Planctomycetota bacterium]
MHGARHPSTAIVRGNENLVKANAFRRGEKDDDGFMSQLTRLEAPHRYSTFDMNQLDVLVAAG